MIMQMTPLSHQPVLCSDSVSERSPPRPGVDLAYPGTAYFVATSGLRRSQVAPDLPTLAESGFPGLEVISWYGLLVPSGTSPSIVQRIRNEAIKAVQAPDVHQALAGQGLQVVTSTPQELAARIRSDTKTWAEVIKSAGIKAE